MSNLAGKAYAITVVNPIKRKVFGIINAAWLKKLIFKVGRALPVSLGGLIGLSIIHFARWAIIKREQWPDLGQGPQNLEHDYFLFCSNFNGTWDQYIDSFSDGIPRGLDLFWYGSLKYPQSIPITPFKNYIAYNQYETNYYYNATPGSAQRDIVSSLYVLGAMRELAQNHHKMNPETFTDAYREQLVNVQNCLGSSGLAPVASLATATANKNRLEFIGSR